MEWPQPDPDLDRGRGEQCSGQDSKGHDERAGEGRGRSGQISFVRRGDDAEGSGYIGQRHCPLYHDQLLPLRSADSMAVDGAVGERVGRQADGDIPERPGSEDGTVGPVDLPVGPRIRLAESGIAGLMRQDELSRGSSLESGRDLLDLDRQFGLESPIDVGAEQSRQ